MATCQSFTLRAAARRARLFSTDSGACITQSGRAFPSWKEPLASIAPTRTTRRRTSCFRPPLLFGRQSLNSCRIPVERRRWQSATAEANSTGDDGDTIQKQSLIDQQGIFRLLNDDERELLRMQRELTSETVRFVVDSFARKAERGS